MTLQCKFRQIAAKGDRSHPTRAESGVLTTRLTYSIAQIQRQVRSDSTRPPISFLALSHKMIYASTFLPAIIIVIAASIVLVLARADGRKGSQGSFVPRDAAVHVGRGGLPPLQF